MCDTSSIQNLRLQFDARQVSSKFFWPQFLPMKPHLPLQAVMLSLRRGQELKVVLEGTSHAEDAEKDREKIAQIKVHDFCVISRPQLKYRGVCEQGRESWEYYPPSPFGRNYPASHTIQWDAESDEQKSWGRYKLLSMLKSPLIFDTPGRWSVTVLVTMEICVTRVSAVGAPEPLLRVFTLDLDLEVTV